MDHARIISARDLESFADKHASRGVLPELIKQLVTTSCLDLTRCSIQDADHIDRAGVDGIIELEAGYPRFVPSGKSYWEVSNERDPRRKVTADLNKRTGQVQDAARANITFVFATFRPWGEARPEAWLQEHATKGWKDLLVLDSEQLADWLQQFPAVARWLLTRIDPHKKTTGWRTVTEHWELLRNAHRLGDPDLSPSLFLARREKAATAVHNVFAGAASQLCVGVENGRDLKDFVAALVANQDEATRAKWSSRCLFIDGRDEWSSMAQLPSRHVLVADERLELDGAEEALRLEALTAGHAVILPVRATAPGAAHIIPLATPTRFQVEEQLRKDGYSTMRVREVVADGFSSMSILKNRLQGQPDQPGYAGSPVARQLALAGLAGGWEEAHGQDLDIVASILGVPFAEWQKVVLPILHSPGVPLAHRDRRWRVLARGEAWAALGRHLVDNDLRLFHDAALRVLGEIDPAIELPKEERVFAATIYKKVRQFSQVLRKGMAETLALLGSRPADLPSCHSDRPAAVAARVVDKLLVGADWTRWMSVHDLLPILAEAAPEAFLHALEMALEDPPSSSFPKLFAQERTGFGGWNYTSGLLWALETLAWHPAHLVRVVRVLATLASIDPGGQWANRPANSLNAILLPWHPQTAAPIERRVVAVKAVMKSHPDVAWDLLVSLLPETGDSTSGACKPIWRTELMDGWEEGVSNAAYFEQVERYAAMALELAAADMARLGALIENIPKLPPASAKAILEQLVPIGLKGKDEGETLPVWEALVALASRHRAFPDATWVMQEEEIAAVERAAAAIEPRDPVLRHRRAFGPPNFDMLVFGPGVSWDDHERIVRERRRAALSEIVNGPSIAKAVEFAGQVEAPAQVGEALAALERTGDDAQVLPDLLDAAEPHIRVLVAGFVLARWRASKWDWVGSLDLAAWSPAQTVALFLMLPFQPEVWRRADEVLGPDAAEYWKAVPANPWGRDDLEEAAERLIHHGRARFAVGCCGVALVAQQALAPAVAIRALRACMTDTSKDPFDTEMATKVITWLQEQPGVDEEEMFSIEWYYLPLLEHRDDAGPKVLEARLARDPKLFCEFVQLVYRSEHEVEGQSVEAAPDEVNRRRAAGQLLHGMRAVPGLQADGTFDGLQFEMWYSEVMRIAGETGHRRGAMVQIGEIVARAATADDWYVTMAPIAEALDASDADAMRRAFRCQLYNSRGAYLVTGGREEIKIAKRYEKQAEALEERGWSRLANTMRELATSYMREAERASREAEEEE